MHALVLINKTEPWQSYSGFCEMWEAMSQPMNVKFSKRSIFQSHSRSLSVSVWPDHEKYSSKNLRIFLKFCIQPLITLRIQLPKFHENRSAGLADISLFS